MWNQLGFIRKHETRTTVVTNREARSISRFKSVLLILDALFNASDKLK
jgi:hypothetical protein